MGRGLVFGLGSSRQLWGVVLGFWLETPMNPDDH